MKERGEEEERTASSPPGQNSTQRPAAQEVGKDACRGYGVVQLGGDGQLNKQG
jgi:hypothetical protein